MFLKIIREKKKHDFAVMVMSIFIFFYDNVYDRNDDFYYYRSCQCHFLNSLVKMKVRGLLKINKYFIFTKIDKIM